MLIPTNRITLGHSSSIYFQPTTLPILTNTHRPLPPPHPKGTPTNYVLLIWTGDLNIFGLAQVIQSDSILRLSIEKPCYNSYPRITLSIRWFKVPILVLVWRGNMGYFQEILPTRFFSLNCSSQYVAC
jgi:hypothetical protein